MDVKGLRVEAPAVRLFILGARAESSLPRDAWVQLAHLFPHSRIHLIFIGPESMLNRDDEFPLPPRTASNPFGAIVEDRVWPTMKISTIVDYYHTLHEANTFHPYDPYFDCFVMFHPGLGHPSSSHEWEETIPMLLETKAPIIVTGYTQADMQRDIDWVNKTAAGEFDVLMEPGENRFRSLRWDLNDMDPEDVSAGNWGVWAFRGKRLVFPPALMAATVLPLADIVSLQIRDYPEDCRAMIQRHLCLVFDPLFCMIRRFGLPSRPLYQVDVQIPRLRDATVCAYSNLP
jgi:splicing suppressor protein 51